MPNAQALFFVLVAFGVGCSSTPQGGGDGPQGQMDLSQPPGADLASFPSDGPRNADLTMPPGDGGSGSLPDTVITVILENTSYSDIVGSSNAPYINGLIGKYGLATNYMDSGTHPSLPNYLYLVSGATQYPGFIDVGPTQVPWFPANAPHLGSQLKTAGVNWREYAEGMGTACNLTDSGAYATKHVPFLYFTDIQSDMTWCKQSNVDYSNFAADLAGGYYRYMFVTPDLNDDGHDTNLMTADTWCSKEVQKMIDSAIFKSGRTVIFLTWDEGTSSLSDHVPMIVITPKIKSMGYQSGAAFTHASYLATVEDLFKLPRLGAAMAATNLYEFFQ